MNKEIWKDIEGYEGLYQISNHGRFRGLERRVKYKHSGTRTISGKIMKPFINRYGYPTAYLSKEGLRKRHSIHRLVAKAFLNRPSDWDHIESTHTLGYTVNHKDGIKINNHVNNLEWVTQSENLLHAYEKGLKNNLILIENNEVRKIKVLLVELNLEFESLRSAAIWIRDNTDNPKACAASISKVLKAKAKTAYKYNWKAI